MPRIFGFDIGTTSIGFAVIEHDPETGTGNILRLGVRIFPEARDPDGTPLNQQRRQKRMVRRQLRRRRRRRRVLNETLSAAGLLPAFGSPDWLEVMKTDPYDLRSRGLQEALLPREFGRALYHLAQRRHFRGRELEESDDERESEDEAEKDADEKAVKKERESTRQALKAKNITLGVYLAGKDADAAKKKPPTERRRGVPAHRSAVEDEFEKLWEAQKDYHAILRDDAFKPRVKDAIFSQRPVFWRKNTLGECRFMPGEALCPKGAWLSQQRRMLEKLNNLALAGGNQRPLDKEERAAILERLQSQASMSWGAVRSALKPLYKARGEPGAEKSLRFNLELGGDKKLLGNAVEAKLSAVFGADWADHPHKQAIRDAVHQRLWSADYGEIGDQRVVILSERERERRRVEAAQSFVVDFGVTPDQAKALQKLTFPAGWEPYSIAALRAFLPQLEAGMRFGALVNGPEWESWRNETFPTRDQPTGEVLDLLPSPAAKAEQERITKLRNPTVARTQNELRKIVNNLVGLFGKPDLIRVELAREVGKSKREREEMQAGMRKREFQREAAVKDLASKGIMEPSRDVVDKWILWKESREHCPYTGDQICFDALFREGRYEVEHIWPRSRSFDDSLANKTLCRKEINIEKGNQTPFEHLGHDADRWAAIKNRLDGMMAKKGGPGMARGKIKRFVAESLPDGFTERQLRDTSYAARGILGQLKRLWPDVGLEAPVSVQPVTGRVTGQLRRLWELNNVLADDGEKTRADHRHHAMDALTVACTHPGMTNRLSRYWQAFDDPRAQRPSLPPPWPAIRADAERAVADIVVSHRVRKKVSGPLHKETVYGDTGEDAVTKSGTYRQFVTRKKLEALSKGELEEIRDGCVRRIVMEHVEKRGGDPKKAFPPYPRISANGPEIRKVRLTSKQQLRLMVKLKNGYADPANNHHIAIYRLPNGKADFEVVSLCEATRRLAKREALVRRERVDGASFLMSLSQGDAVQFSDGPEKGIWIVKGIEGDGRASLARHADARPSTAKEAERLGMDRSLKLFRPRLGGFLRRNPRKISIDPIGRIRPAND